MFIELLKRYAKWMTSNPLIAAIGLFTHSLTLFVLCQIVYSILVVLTLPGYTLEYDRSLKGLNIALLVITLASLLFSACVWYYKRSKKAQ
jgi:membrane-anchored protein YejM (alkaline phosphatase superfamily)